MFNGDGYTAPPKYDLNSVAIKQEEPDIVRAARAYEESRRAFEHLQTERQRIDERVKDAQNRMHEAAQHMLAIIQPETKAYRS